MNYITIKDVAAKWSISDRRVLQYCNAGRIPGAAKMGNTWIVPKDAEKPRDERYKTNVDYSENADK
jgi:predicted site-specific integrase-resolvase